MSSEHAEARDDCREGGMTAALKPPSLLRTATGEPPLGRNAEFFTDDQGEIFEYDNPRHRSSLTWIGCSSEGGKVRRSRSAASGQLRTFVIALAALA